MPMAAQGEQAACGRIPATWARDGAVVMRRKDGNGSERAQYLHYTFAHVFPARKLILCSIPGAGSTWIRKLLLMLHALLDGKPAGRARGPWPNATLPVTFSGRSGDHIHFELAQARAMGIVALESLPLNEVARIGCDPTWTRLAFVRNPYARLQSKYVDKIINDKHSHPNRVPLAPGEPIHGAKWVRKVSFAELVRRMRERSEAVRAGRYPLPVGGDGNDEHFRAMSNFCGIRHLPYRHVYYEELRSSAAELLRTLGLESNPEVQNVLGELRPRYPTNFTLLAEHYTPEVTRQVREYYAEDFRRFGYPLSICRIDEAGNAAQASARSYRAGAPRPSADDWHDRRGAAACVRQL